MALYHKTSLGNAISILQDQELHSGKHRLCGPKVIFVLDPDQMPSKPGPSDVTLRATVNLGNTMRVRPADSGANWPSILPHEGYDSVQCTSLGHEYVVYDSTRVCSIELYCARPYRFTGRLQGSADGSSPPGESLVDHGVRVMRIHPGPMSQYPVLVGDEKDDQLGWCELDSLTPV
jgi:hypothetical protein